MTQDQDMPGAIEAGGDLDIDMKKCNAFGESVCGMLNVAKMTPNEAFMALLAVVGSVADAASPSVMDQLDMRQRFGDGLMKIGLNMARTQLDPNIVGAPATEQ